MVALVLASAGCLAERRPRDPELVHRLADLAQLAPGWDGEIIARVDQSYAGWDVEIGDADGDGRPEILTGSAPDSRLYQFRKRDGAWRSRVLVDRAAASYPGLLLGVEIVDLDGDGAPEVVAGTGEEDGAVATLQLLRTDGEAVTARAQVRSPDNRSSYTHGLAHADLDHDGALEIVSAYCGNGEVIRYDVGETLAEIGSRKVVQLSGSGEDVLVVDVDGDGDLEMLMSNGFRDGAAQVEIYDLDPATGDPWRWPRLVLDGFDGRAAFYASLAVGDLDDDGRPELVVGWKAEQETNRATLVAYRIEGRTAEVAYLLSREDQDLDLGYFEKMMAIADVDDDGRNELLLSTRGDGSSEGIGSAHLGHVYRYLITDAGEVRREQILDFDQDHVESSWLAVGDADGDRRTELVLATGWGDRTEPGTSWVIALHRTDGRDLEPERLAAAD